jgi:hypothetical protein
MSSSSVALQFITAASIYSTYITYITFAIGLIGNVLNILVFTRLKIFRLNCCAFYLTVESIIDIVQLSQTVVNEILKLIYGSEPINVLLVWCKLSTMLPQWCRLMLASIVCFVALDQFLSTNHQAYLRRLSSLTVTRYQIVFAVCLCLLHTVPFAIFLQIHSSYGCIITNTYLTEYYSYFFYPVLNGLFPICMSSLFSILAYRNVRRIVRRQIPIDRRRLDQQLTAMIFVRVIFFVLLQIGFTVYRIYALNVKIVPNNTLGYAAQLWVQVITISLVYFSHAVILSFLFSENIVNINYFR